MPELPEVETIVRELNQHLVGRTIALCRVLRPQMVRPESVRFETATKGQKVIEVVRKGKYLCIRFVDLSWLVVHLRMTGKFVFQSQMNQPHPHDRVIFYLDQGVCLFNDMRCFGTLELVGSLKDIPAIHKLGVEPLSSRFTSAFLQQICANSRKEIKVMLMDQSSIAGVGNIYAAEALYRAGIHPARKANRLKKTEIVSLHRNLRKLLNEALKHNGTTISDYRRVDEKTGEFQNFLNVYGKNGEKCAKCGHIIEVIKQQQRSTYYCSGCQK